MASTLIDLNTQAATGSCTTAVLGAGAVTSAKIAAGAVTTTELGALAVTSAKIAALAVTSAELAASAVTAGKIATGGVSAAGQFAAGVVDTAALGALQVTTAKIAAGAVTTAEHGDLSVTTAKLAANAVTPAKADLAQVWAFTAAPSYNADPSAANDLARKSYVDAIKTGLDFKDSCRAATTAALEAHTRTGNVLTRTGLGALPAIDGVTLVLNDRLLVKDETATLEHGLYYVSAVGSGVASWTLTRTTDADSDAEVNAGMFTFIEEGTTNGDTGWVLSTNNPITLNTTGLSFVQFSSAGVLLAGAGMTKTSNTIDVIAADNSLTINADNMAVKLDTAATTGNITINAAAGIRAATDGVGIETATNALQLKDLGVTTAKLAANAVTTAKITDANVTWGKLDTTASTGVSVRIGRYDRREERTTSTATLWTLAVTDCDTADGAHMVFKNGVLLRSGAGNDYTITASAVTFLAAPLSTDLTTILYKRTGSTQ